MRKVCVAESTAIAMSTLHSSPQLPEREVFCCTYNAYKGVHALVSAGFSRSVIVSYCMLLVNPISRYITLSRAVSYIMRCLSLPLLLAAFHQSQTVCAYPTPESFAAAFSELHESIDHTYNGVVEGRELENGEGGADQQAEATTSV